MTPATAEALAFNSEGDAGNTNENFRELFAVEQLRRRGRLEDSICTADEFGVIADASREDRARRSVNARIEDGAARLHCVSQDAAGRDFVADGCVGDDRRCAAV